MHKNQNCEANFKKAVCIDKINQYERIFKDT